MATNSPSLSSSQNWSPCSVLVDLSVWPKADPGDIKKELEDYFSDINRSQGGGVQDVVLCTDLKYAIVSFTDPDGEQNETT